MGIENQQDEEVNKGLNIDNLNVGEWANETDISKNLGFNSNVVFPYFDKPFNTEKNSEFAQINSPNHSEFSPVETKSQRRRRAKKLRDKPKKRGFCCYFS